MTDSRQHHEHLRVAIELSLDGVHADVGGPFGAVVVRDGVVIGRGQNRVVNSLDPTAHAEIVALREACRTVNDFSLVGATLYSSCEPCPMCLAAAWWARVDAIVYSCTREDAAAIGFDDELFYEQLALPVHARVVPMLQELRDEGLAAFRAWGAKPDKKSY